MAALDWSQCSAVESVPGKVRLTNVLCAGGHIVVGIGAGKKIKAMLRQ